MEKTIKINGSLDEMEDIFNNSKSINIRYYKQLKQNRFEVVIRFSEHLEASITKTKTIRELIKIDTF